MPTFRRMTGVLVGGGIAWNLNFGPWSLSSGGAEWRGEEYFRGFPWKFGYCAIDQPRYDINAILYDLLVAIMMVWLISQLIALGPRQCWSSFRAGVIQMRTWGTSLSET